MATQFEVVLPWGARAAADAATSALELIDQLEDQLSVFRHSSELSRINRTAAHAPMPVEPRLFELLVACERLSRESQGAFDITASPLTRVWGFFDRDGRMPGESDLAAARRLVGMHGIQFNPERRTVRFAQRGIELNLGSIGKGFALDRAAELLRSHWRQQNFLLEGGASSIMAVGSPPDDSRGWSVSIRHPLNDRPAIRVHLRDRSLGVTGSERQYFSYNGRKLGHVLDPRTGWPCEECLLTVALAPSAAEADALSTAFFVLGVDGTARYCADHPEVAALVVSHEGECDWRTFNLNDFEFQSGPAMTAVLD